LAASPIDQPADDHDTATAEDRAPRVGVHDQPQQRQVAVFLVGHDGDGGTVGNGREMLPVLDGGVLDVLHRRLGLLCPAMGEQPAGAFGEIAPDEQDHDGE
jgi:hypothetical protein